MIKGGRTHKSKAKQSHIQRQSPKLILESKPKLHRYSLLSKPHIRKLSLVSSSSSKKAAQTTTKKTILIMTQINSRTLNISLRRFRIRPSIRRRTKLKVASKEISNTLKEPPNYHTKPKVPERAKYSKRINSNSQIRLRATISIMRGRGKK